MSDFISLVAKSNGRTWAPRRDAIRLVEDVLDEGGGVIGVSVMLTDGSQMTVVGNAATILNELEN